MEYNYLRDELYRGASVKIVPGTEIVRVWPITAYVGTKKAKAINAFFEELDFKELPCASFRRIVIKEKTAWVPDYNSWEVNFKNRTYKKTKYLPPLTRIVAPSAIKTYVEEYASLLLGYKYGI